MGKLCLMASHGCPAGLVGQGLVFHQEQNRVLKDYQPFLPSSRTKQDIVRLNLLDSRSTYTPLGVVNEANQVIGKPLVANVQDLAYFSFGIAKQCTNGEKIIRFLMSGSVELDKGRLDLSLLPELMELQRITSSLQYHQPSSLIYPNLKSDAPNPLVDFVGDMADGSKITIGQDGRVFLASSGLEMTDIISVVAEFYLSKSAIQSKMSSILVPHFTRPEISASEANVLNSSLKIKDDTAAALKSPEKIKLKPSLKKNNRKKGKERDLYKRSYFHACESLLSLMMGKKWNQKAAISSLKKSGPELPQLLTQFSAGIAGTGLAVILSVVCKVACGRVPFCATKLFSTGFGFGLVWLSWAVNRLRDTIVLISKNASKLSDKDEEMVRSVDKNLKQIYFRAATLMAVALLRFA